MNVSLVIVTQNGTNATISAIRSFKVPFEKDIIVINNNCYKEHLNIIKKELNDVRHIDLCPSKGLTHCWNTGIINAVNDWVIISNDDVIFDADWYEKFMKATHEYPNALHISLSYPKNTYSCFVIHKKLIALLGWFDERFTGARYEDDDWHLRLYEYSGFDLLPEIKKGRNDLIFAITHAALHDKALRNEDLKKYGNIHKLSFDVNRKFFYKKWEVGGKKEPNYWLSKGKPYQRLRRLLNDVDWYPYFTKQYQEKFKTKIKK